MTTPAEPKGYSEHIIAFLDVLGLKDAIKESMNDTASSVKIAGLLTELYEIAARRTRHFSESPKSPNIRVSAFMDSIFISCPIISEESFRFVLWVISEFCLSTVINHGFFVRGVLTIGPHWEDEGISFGPALIRAYEMEQSLAMWPRCIVDPVALTRRDICPGGSWKKRYLYVLVGTDGLPYLDYLGYAFNTFAERMIMYRSRAKPDSHGPNPDELMLKVIRFHKRAIHRAVQEAKKNKAQTTILPTKYYPLALYHNAVIRKLERGAPRSFVSRFESIATEAEMDPKVIKQMKREFLLSWNRSQEKWQGELIDLDSMFAEYGESAAT